MDTVVKKLYEGLFLVDSGAAASDWQGIIDSIEKILARGGAEIVSMNKWDERKLAYAINKKDRGTYILVYFNGDPGGVSVIERDVQLSEQIMRVMILRTDKMSQEDMDKESPVLIAKKAAAEAAEKAAARAAEAEAVAAEKAATKAAEAEAEAEVSEEPEAAKIEEAVPEEATREVVDVEEAVDIEEKPEE